MPRHAGTHAAVTRWCWSGTLGEAPERTVLVETVEDVPDLVVPDPARVAYLTQTTPAVDETTEVVELANRCGTTAHLIEGAGDLRPEWLTGVNVVALTAGASAPPHLVDEVVAALAPGTVTERETARFTLPRAVTEPPPSAVDVTGRRTGATLFDQGS